jgi:signal transduction histidine kinase
MTTTKKHRGHGESRKIEDALIESALDTPADLFRAEMEEAGEDTASYVSLSERMMAEARKMAGRERLARARTEIVAFRSREERSPLTSDAADAAARMAAFRAQATSTPLMMAARKGKELSASDDEVVAASLVKLERLRREDGDA